MTEMEKFKFKLFKQHFDETKESLEDLIPMIEAFCGIDCKTQLDYKDKDMKTLFRFNHVYFTAVQLAEDLKRFFKGENIES